MPEDDAPYGTPGIGKQTDGFGVTIRYQLKKLAEKSRRLYPIKRGYSFDK